MIKRIMLGLFAAAVLITSLTGCNTMRGGSDDVENTVTVPSNVPPPP